MTPVELAVRISQFGTFDVANYGDLLFPLLAKKRLQALPGISLEHISPVGAGPVWSDTVETVGFQAFLDKRQAPDGMLIGGGNIIHLTATPLPHYERDLVPVLGYADLWVGATACAAAASTRVCWNAPGVPKRFPTSLHSIVRQCLERADYISVRDDISRERLLEAWRDAQIEVVPDTAWEVDQLWSHDELRTAHETVLLRFQASPPQRALAIHVNSRYLGERGPGAVARRLDDLCRRLDARGVLLAIGPCHGDDELARRVGAAMKTNPIVIDRPGGVQELAACIALAVAYVGSSMHDFITAASFGVPAMCVASPGASKFPGLFPPLELSHAWSETWESVPALLCETGLEVRREELQRVRRAVQPRLDTHWAAIVTAMGGRGGRLAPDEPQAATAPRSSTETAHSYRARVLATTALEEFGAHRTETARRRALETRIRTLRKKGIALRADLALRAVEISALNSDLAERRREIASLRAGLNERQREVASLRHELLTLKRQLSSTRAALQIAISSASWKLTAPLRAISAASRTWPARLMRGLNEAAYMIPRLITRHPRESVHLIHAFLTLRQSREFDASYYLRANRDVAAAGIDPLMHYVFRGAFVGRDPNARFSSASYFRDHPAVAAARLNPLVHHLRRSRRQANARKTKPAAMSWGSAGLRSSQGGGARESSLFFQRVHEIGDGRDKAELLLALERSEARVTDLDGALGPLDGPLVSIIMPTRDRADIIGDAIRTVLEQDYPNWELLVCDDGSTDDTRAVVAAFVDPRILYLELPKGGAARARNAGLAAAKGQLIAYLDSDNLWHPRYMRCMVTTLCRQPGHQAAYANYVDVSIPAEGPVAVRPVQARPFDHPRLLERNFIDLNAFVHRKELFSAFGGFDERLTRRQDYDLVLKYTWLRDPLYVDCLLVAYQRSDRLQQPQITQAMKEDTSCVPIIEESITRYYRSGLPRQGDETFRRVTVVSWDVCRNHFAKAFAVAEALSATYEVQLIGFRSFEEDVFEPLRRERPAFQCLFLDGSDFPAFSAAMARAVASVAGDVLYVVKPRLASLGLALLANYHTGKPIILEANDLETVVSSARPGDRHRRVALTEMDPRSPELLSPHADGWSRVMDAVAAEVPFIMTHNANLDRHLGGRSLYMRNIKDETVYDPAAHDRQAIRRELGFAEEDRVILFGGMIRAHKGVFELVQLSERLGEPRYRVLLVGSRITPDQVRLVGKHRDRVVCLPPQDRAAMARINLASDLVVIWLNPEVPASHYQMPYKLTDAFAMQVPVIANDISDLGELGRQGYLRLVPFGDWEAMVAAVHQIFDEPDRTAAMVASARALFLRQFSYNAARANFALAMEHVRPQAGRTLPVAADFAAWFAEFNQFARSGSRPQGAR